MRPAHGRPLAGVIERLLAAPHRFGFVPAVAILLVWLAEQGMPEDAALHTCLRFENSLHVGFPPSEIEAIERLDGPRFAITPAFMGLLGTQGTLPAHVSERIAAWQTEHDDAAPRAFLDLLSNRMLALFYRAAQAHRLEHLAGGLGGGPDRLQPMLLALAGCPPASTADSPAPLATLTAHFAGLLQQRPCSGMALARMLASYFGIPVQLEEAVGHWDVLRQGERCALGVNAELGENMLLGERSWRPDLRARLRIGPVDGATFARFLPSGDASALLSAILRRFAGPTVGFEVQLVLRAEDVRPLQLGGAPGAGRLGRDSFLQTGRAARDRADMRYLMLPMARLGADPCRRENKAIQ